MLNNNYQKPIKKVLFFIIGFFILSFVFVLSFFLFIFFVSSVITLIVLRAILKKVGKHKSTKYSDYDGETISDVDFTVLDDGKK